MTLAYLVDTDRVIHWLNGHAGIGQRLNDVKDQGLALSMVSLAELYEGVYHSTVPESNERHLMNFLQGVTVVGRDVETCQVFGTERGRLRAAGARIADFDLLIGATALRHNWTVFTNNRWDFEVIAGLRLESA